MKKSVRIFGKKAIPIWLLVLVLVAVSSGAAAGTILAGKVVGEVPVAVSQALLVGTPEFSDNATADSDMPQQVYDHADWIQAPNRAIGVVADDHTAFQAAMELAVGDWAQIKLPVKNASENDLYALLTLNVPDGLEVEIWIDEGTADLQDIVRVGLNTWKFEAQFDADYASSDLDFLRIVVSVDDDAPPGYYTISGTIKQIPY